MTEEITRLTEHNAACAPPVVLLLVLLVMPQMFHCGITTHFSMRQSQCTQINHQRETKSTVVCIRRGCSDTPSKQPHTLGQKSLWQGSSFFGHSIRFEQQSKRLFKVPLVPHHIPEISEPFFACYVHCTASPENRKRELACLAAVKYPHPFLHEPNKRQCANPALPTSQFVLVWSTVIQTELLPNVRSVTFQQSPFCDRDFFCKMQNCFSRKNDVLFLFFFWFFFCHQNLVSSWL